MIERPPAFHVLGAHLRAPAAAVCPGLLAAIRDRPRQGTAHRAALQLRFVVLDGTLFWFVVILVRVKQDESTILN